MKKFSILTITLALFILGLSSGIDTVSAGDGTCTPTQGFSWCYWADEAGYGDSYCYAQVQGSLPICEGTRSGSKCAGEWAINIGIGGDEGYIVKSASGWDVYDQCGSSGCPSQYKIKGGSNVLQDAIGGAVPKYYLIAWDYDSQDDGSWCWVSKAAGYLGDYFAGYEVVECINNGDCESGESCNSNNECVQEGECQEDIDCPMIIQDTFYCSSDGDIVKDTMTSGCVNHQCVDDAYTQEKVLVTACDFGCTQDGTQYPTCNDEPPECSLDSDCPEGYECNTAGECVLTDIPSQTNWKLIAGIVAAVLVVVAGIVFALSSRKGKKR